MDKEEDVITDTAATTGRTRKVSRERLARYALASLAALAILLGIRGVSPFDRWSLNSLLLATALLAVLFLRFEERDYGSREVAVVGALAAVGAAGRVLFAALPGVQPSTFIAFMAGHVFGAETGFTVGALVALLSNLFLGQGPWTPWQMLAWGAAGASGALVARMCRGRLRPRVIAATLFSWGFLFGWMMNLWFWLSFVQPLTLRSYLATCLTSVWFDSFHAAGNLFFAAALSRPVGGMLARFRERFTFTHESEESGFPAAAPARRGIRRR